MRAGGVCERKQFIPLHPPSCINTHHTYNNHTIKLPLATSARPCTHRSHAPHYAPARHTCGMLGCNTHSNPTPAHTHPSTHRETSSQRLPQHTVYRYVTTTVKTRGGQGRLVVHLGVAVAACVCDVSSTPHTTTSQIFRR